LSFELPGDDQNPPSAHVADLLPDYVNATLDATEHERVREHLATCAECGDELALWQGIAAASRERLAPSAIEAPSLTLLDGVWAQIDAPAPIYRRALEGAADSARATRRHATYVWQVLRAQAPLVPRGIWLVSAAAIALTFFVVSLWPGNEIPPTLLRIVLPLVTAAGIAFISGPEQDPSLELALATPASPRLVLLCRLSLVFGYNVALALGVTLLLVIFRGAPFSLLASVWIGPMLLLAGLSLLLSVTAGTMAGVASAIGLVMLRLFVSTLGALGGVTRDAWHLGLLDALWQTTPALLALALVLYIAAVLLVSRQEPSHEG
jgi:hypothetical protein